MIVYLSDLQNSYDRYLRNSIPIGVGYVASYLKKRFGSDIEIHIFRKFEELYDSLSERTPDLAAFGSYCWNTNLTLGTARHLRQRFPDLLIAVGGPDVADLPEMILANLRANPQIDFYIPNEGEHPAANLVEALLSGKSPSQVRAAGVPGCLSLTPSGELSGSSLAQFPGDINDIPSPYFDGLMDRFLKDIDYMPTIQTSRGCPYACTYCACGNTARSKIRTFDMERVKAEIDYVATHARNSFLRFVDENIGILPRDQEIVEYLIEQKKLTGFPQSGSIYTDKHPTDRVKQICWLMREIIPFCVSFQSTTPAVLKTIKRVNLTDEEVRSAVHFARERKLIMVSELIFMLPGETIASFLASVQKLIDFRFESMEVGPLQILKGSEMDTPQDRRKNGVKTMFSVAEKGYTCHPELENIEIDEWVVANNTISEEEHFKALRFIYLLDFAHYRSFLKEILFFFECHGVPTSKLLMQTVERPDLCPLLAGGAAQYAAGMRDFLFDTPQQVQEFVREKIAAKEELLGFYDLRRKLMIDLLISGGFPSAVDEMIGMGTLIYRERFGELPDGFHEELALVRALVLNMFIPIQHPVPCEVELESRFDIHAWIAGNYGSTLASHRLAQPTTLTLKVRGFNLYDDIWRMDESALTKYRMAFRIFTSANRRRFLDAAPSQNL